LYRRIRLFALLGLCGLSAATWTCAQDEPSAPIPQQQGQGRPGGGREGGRPVFGQITALRNDSIDIKTPDGQAITVKLTAQTEFRKDREPAKIADFKVGDVVMVRGDQNDDHTVTAKMIGSRTGGMTFNGQGGPGGRPGGGMWLGGGTLGKDYVAGEVKSIDPPKLTVLRTDNVTQTMELNEDTSLRRGRESITMADIKPGDHVVARGAAQNDVFVPKNVMVMSPEQWQRMQQMMSQGNGNAEKPASQEATAPKPQE
jgi:Domain of unknown function (DUF5666)